MKKKIFLCWHGEGPESSNQGQNITVEIDIADLIYDENDQEELDELEAALKAFAEDLKKRFSADDCQTEASLAALDKWVDEEMARQ